MSRSELADDTEFWIGAGIHDLTGPLLDARCSATSTSLRPRAELHAPAFAGVRYHFAQRQQGRLRQATWA
jgi:hypothetical protein